MNNDVFLDNSFKYKPSCVNIFVKVKQGGLLCMNLEVVKSDSAVAGKIATAIASSLDGGTNGGAILTDTQTTVAGNTNAQEAIQSMLNGQNKIVQAISKASSNLQSVAHEFEEADQATRQLMSAISIPSPTGGK